MSDDPEFVRFTDTGRVHVYRDLVVIDTSTARFRPPRAGDEMGLLIMARQRALCGKVAPGPSLFGISSFPDERLCRRCFDTWVRCGSDGDRLFDHEVGP